MSETDHFQISTVDTDVENEQQETYLDVPIVEDEQNQFGHRGSRVRLRSIDDIQKPEKKEKVSLGDSVFTEIRLQFYIIHITL